MTDQDDRTPPTKGAELQTLRLKAGHSQATLAQLIGCTRNAVSYWEMQAVITKSQLRYGVPMLIGKVLGFEYAPIKRSRTRARGDGVLLREDACQRALDREAARIRARLETKAALQRQICGAKTRKGQPCRNMSEAGRRRCKFHGGRSTGPRTIEGRARISSAQAKRWAAHRAKHKARNCRT